MSFPKINQVNKHSDNNAKSRKRQLPQVSRFYPQDQYSFLLLPFVKGIAKIFIASV